MLRYILELNIFYTLNEIYCYFRFYLNSQKLCSLETKIVLKECISEIWQFRIIISVGVGKVASKSTNEKIHFSQINRKFLKSVYQTIPYRIE